MNTLWRERLIMNRRQFLLATTFAASAQTGLAAGFAFAKASRGRVRWTRTGELFTAVICDGEPMSATKNLLDATCRHDGAMRVRVEHRLRESGAGFGEDVLEVTLTVRNPSDRPTRAEIEFLTAPRIAEQRVYLPLSFAGGNRFAELGVENFHRDCNQPVGTDDFTAHYLEPLASFAAERKTRAPLLAPVVDVFGSQRPWRLALFTPSDQPMRFRHSGGAWRVGRQVRVAAGGTFTQRCWLMVHQGDAAVAWRAFHRFAHREDFPVPEWAHQFRVHFTASSAHWCARSVKTRHFSPATARCRHSSSGPMASAATMPIRRCSATRSTRRSRCVTSLRWATNHGARARGISKRCGPRR
jgi:hypothetical protein